MARESSRLSKALKGSFTSLLVKVASFVCTFFLTREILRNFGSEINGMLNSITQFLAIISLFEAGVGGIARAALYKPLAKKDFFTISKLIKFIKRFFRILALIFLAYAIVIAFIFPYFSENNSFVFSFILVLIISIGTFMEYFFGISYSILLYADQKSYISNSAYFLTIILNFIVCLILIRLGFNIQIVKLGSALIFILKPLFMCLYCEKKYPIDKKILLKRNENVLPQKWSGLGVHIAYYLHRNTDVVLVTLFLSLSAVSVYSVYNMVLSGIISLLSAMFSGFEASFGDLYAKNDIERLKKSFKAFVFCNQIICTIIFSCTFVLINQFVHVYTLDIFDANYYQPILAIFLVLAEFVYCLRAPYNDLMVATNSFNKMTVPSFIEAAINIFSSIILLLLIGLPGVAIGTFLAMLFRLIHFLCFFSNSELHIEKNCFFYNLTLNSISMIFSISICNITMTSIYDFSSWLLNGFLCFSISAFVTIFINLMFNKKCFLTLKNVLKNKKGK